MSELLAILDLFPGRMEVYSEVKKAPFCTGKAGTVDVTDRSVNTPLAVRHSEVVRPCTQGMYGPGGVYTGIYSRERQGGGHTRVGISPFSEGPEKPLSHLLPSQRGPESLFHTSFFFSEGS